MEDEVDQDAVCKLCEAHYEWGSSLCEGARCQESHDMYLEEQEEYLNEGGKDVSEFKKGDKVECVNTNSYGKYDAQNLEKDGIQVGNLYIVNAILSTNYIGFKGSTYCHHPSNFKLATTKTQTTKENNMNISDNILTVFEDSATTAGKVAKRFGSEYGDTTRDLLALKRDKKDLLAIIKDEEEAEKDK